MISTHPTFTHVPPDRPCSINRVFAPYQPEALRAAPLPPLPPPMTIKSNRFGVGAIAFGAVEKCVAILCRRRDARSVGLKVRVWVKCGVDIRRSGVWSSEHLLIQRV